MMEGICEQWVLRRGKAKRKERRVRDDDETDGGDEVPETCRGTPGTHGCVGKGGGAMKKDVCRQDAMDAKGYSIDEKRDGSGDVEIERGMVE